MTRTTGADRNTTDYDAVGRPGLAQRGTPGDPDAVSDSTFFYTGLGDLDAEVQTIAGGTPRTIDYGYDQAGNRIQLIYPSGPTLRFVALLSVRAGAGAKSDYGGPSVAAHQLKAYPKLGSVSYRLPPDRVFERALGVARNLGWLIVAAVPDEGRIEASDRSFWFGFTDDPGTVSNAYISQWQLGEMVARRLMADLGGKGKITGMPLRFDK